MPHLRALEEALVRQGWRITAVHAGNDYNIAGTWQPNDPASFIQPEAFANDGGLGTVRGNSTNSFTGDLRNRMWQKHQFRTGFTWTALVLALGLVRRRPVDSPPPAREVARSH